MNLNSLNKAVKWKFTKFYIILTINGPVKIICRWVPGFRLYKSFENKATLHLSNFHLSQDVKSNILDPSKCASM